MRVYKVFIVFLLLFFATSCGGGGGASDSNNEVASRVSAESSWLLTWNAIAYDTSGIDHQSQGNGEQIGPLRTSRALAIVHIAIADALSAIYDSYQPYAFQSTVLPNASPKAAIAAAAYYSLIELYPRQQARLLSVYENELSKIPNDASKVSGIELGRRSAQAIIDIRSRDGSEFSPPYAPIRYQSSLEPGRWRPDPLNPEQEALGAEWNRVVPFVMTHASAFRAVPPPALASKEYLEAFREVKRVGGDGIITEVDRSEDQTHAAIYWAYDGTPSLCAPARMYNQIAAQIASERGVSVDELARFLALLNIALADTGIAVWESKYFYDFWRPVTAIREADIGTGPTRKGDGNPSTIADLAWTPLGSPASNLSTNDFTPPFPTYPSGHAGFGGATFQMLRNYFGTDDIAFTFVSDEFNGSTRGSNGEVRPLKPRSFATLSQAEQENAQSRVWLGVHFSFDKAPAIRQGNTIADQVYSSVFQSK